MDSVLYCESVHVVASAVCPPGFYGDYCELDCHCADGAPCDEETGECPAGCAAGWTGRPHCNVGCAEGYFGPDCNYRCICADRGGCGAENGRCQDGACSLGWSGQNCDKLTTCKCTLHWTSMKSVGNFPWDYRGKYLLDSSDLSWPSIPVLQGTFFCFNRWIVGNVKLSSTLFKWFDTCRSQQLLSYLHCRR